MHDPDDDPSAIDTLPSAAEAEQAPEPLVLEWTETVLCRASLSADEARTLFGLGGTSDDELPWKIVTLAAASASVLRPLSSAGSAEIVRVTRYELNRINDLPPGEL